ncbi:MAG: hypothetical protein ACRYF0_17535 [Janthinobacterium lividum]
MDTLPLDRAPKGPRNLTVLLAAWLRRMGFVVLEQGGMESTALEASWRAPDGLLFQASYHFTPAAGGTFQLLASVPPAPTRGLVHQAEVNRPREVRFLLLSNTFYREARQHALDAGTLLPAHAQPTA